MSSQAALETPVKNAFGVIDAAGRTCESMADGLVGSHVLLTTRVTEMPPLYASSLLPSLHLHNLHKQREVRRVGGGGGEPVDEAELRGAHVQLRLAMWRDKQGSMRGAHATAGFDDDMLRRPYDMLVDIRKTPLLLLRLRSQAEYRRNRKKAESEHIRGALIHDHGYLLIS